MASHSITYKCHITYTHLAASSDGLAQYHPQMSHYIHTPCSIWRWPHTVSHTNVRLHTHTLQHLAMASHSIICFECGIRQSEWSTPRQRRLTPWPCRKAVKPKESSGVTVRLSSFAAVSGSMAVYSCLLTRIAYYAAAYICIYIHIYTYILRESEGKRERDMSVYLQYVCRKEIGVGTVDIDTFLNITSRHVTSHHTTAQHIQYR